MTYLPSLPKFEITDVSFDFKSINIYFVLKYGCLTVLSSMKGEVRIEEFDCQQNGNAENSMEVEFKYMIVGGTPVSVEETEMDIQPNQQLELTEKQTEKLNEILKSEMVRV